MKELSQMQCPKISSRDRDGKLRAAAVLAFLALVSCAAVACSSGEAERAAAGGQATVGSGSNPTASQTTPDQTPSLFGGTERFDSPLNGLSIGYPSGWRTRAAIQPWAGHSDVAFGAPDVDVIFHPKLKDDLYLAVVSEPLGGTSGSDWVDSGSWLTSVGICTDAYGAGGGSNTFQGNAAWFEHCGTPVGSDEFVVFGTARRGYIINFHVGDEHVTARRMERIRQATHHWNLFKAALKTVDLPADDALDAVNSSECP
jgi:hypothetical protein